MNKDDRRFAEAVRSVWQRLPAEPCTELRRLGSYELHVLSSRVRLYAASPMFPPGIKVCEWWPAVSDLNQSAAPLRKLHFRLTVYSLHPLAEAN
jgi:hypothetical protein